MQMFHYPHYLTRTAVLCKGNEQAYAEQKKRRKTKIHILFNNYSCVVVLARYAY